MNSDLHSKELVARCEDVLSRLGTGEAISTERWKEFLADVRQALSTLQQANEDSNRLDFLDQNLDSTVGWRVYIPSHGNVFVGHVFHVGIGEPPTIRAAIDAAMKVTP